MTDCNSDSPENRCGFELHPEDIPREYNQSHWNKYTKPVCCWRPVWKNHEDIERCIWHTDENGKSLDELIRARETFPERLDGAILRGITTEKDSLSFEGCRLIGATFDGSRLSQSEFTDADLRFTEFIDADLTRATFSNADLTLAKFSNADLTRATFSDTVLQWAEFSNADLTAAEFSTVDLTLAEFSKAGLARAEFIDADLTLAAFSDAILRLATFQNTDLRGADFTDADLQDAELSDTDARKTSFRHATLQDAVFTRADCRAAIFTSALLYETVISDTRINSMTTFFDPETTFYESITSRPACIYEENPLITDHLPEDVQPLEAARWVYQRLETVHEQNALPEAASKFRTSAEEVERALARD